MKRLLMVLAVILGSAAAVVILGHTYYSSPEHAQKFFTKVLKEADITIDGDRPWDITIHNPAVFQRVVQEGSLGLGESYKDGWWDVEKLDEFFYRIFKADLGQKLSKNWSDIIDAIMLRLFNYQTEEGSKEVGLRAL